ncbi:hypothetical protein APP_04120 [Aeribacillus pallidus]|nr:hypothetical protein APP_04120 [Aeribacillus pallidus]
MFTSNSVFSFLDKMINIIKYNRKSALRKFLVDWQLDKIDLRKIYAWITLIMIFIMSALFFLTVFLTGYIIKDLDANTWLNVFLSFVIFLAFFNSLSFFNKKSSVFYYDTTKMLSQLKSYRVLQVIASIYGDSLKNTVIMWFVLLMPVVLGIHINYPSFELKFLIYYFPLFSLLSLIMTMFFSYFRFLFAHFFYIQSLRLLNRFFLFIVAALLFFLLPFTIASLLFNSQKFGIKLADIVIKYQSFLMELGLPKDIYNLEFHKLFIVFLFMLFIAGVFTLIWIKTLNHLDLIPYYQIRTRKSSISDKDKFMNTNKYFFVKDILHIKRVSSWFIGHIGKTIFGLLVFVGIALPVVQHFIDSTSPLFFLSIITVFAFAIFQIVGDSLKMILAIDTEAKNIHLLVYTKYTMWDIVKEKWYIYFIFTFLVTFFVVLLSSVFINVNIFLYALSITIMLTYGGLSGLFQIFSTALYPRINWEHPYEIGESHKANFINNILNNGLTFLYTVFIGGLLIADQFFGLKLNTMVACILILTLVAFFFCTYAIIAAYTKQISVKEVFLKND